jgi:hypothetical protein
VTAAVAAGLALLAVVDGACAGFRSSVGRSGLINHRASDHRAARRGAVVVAVLLAPAVALTSAVILLQPSQSGLYLRAGKVMLGVYAPYALAVLAALAVYATLDWRKRYVAMTVVLGPLTLARPLVVVVGGALAIGVTRDAVVAVAVALAVAGILAVEGVADRLWYARERRSVLAG